MGERKVLNKYYLPDFNPLEIPRRRQPKNQQIKPVDNSTAKEPAEAADSKQKWRLSEKGLELQQAEKSKKPTIKNKFNGKSSKSKSKLVELGNENSSAVDDEATEDDEM